MFASMKGREAELIAFESRISQIKKPNKETRRELDILEVDLLESRIEYLKNFRSFILKQKGSYVSVGKILNETVGQMLQALSAKRLALRK